MDFQAAQPYITAMHIAPSSFDATSARAPFLARFSLSEDQKKVLRGLLPYMWPHDRPDLKRTVMWSLS